MDEREVHSVCRRQFFRLGVVGAAVAAGCVAPRAEGPPEPKAKAPDKAKAAEKAKEPQPPPPPPPPYGRYAMGVQSYCFRKFSFEEAVAKTAELGLHYIEPFPGHFRLNSTPERVAAVKSLCAGKQVVMNAYGVCTIGKDEAKARQVFGFCKSVGIGVITANPQPDALDMLDKLVAEYGIQIAIHNHGPGDKRWGRLEQLINGTKDHHAHIGVCLDTGHLARAGDAPIGAVRSLGPRLLALHLKDWNAQKHDCVIGKGELDVAAFFAALGEAGFDGPCSIEYEIDANNPVPGIRESLVAVRAAIAAGK